MFRPERKRIIQTLALVTIYWKGMKTQCRSILIRKRWLSLYKAEENQIFTENCFLVLAVVQSLKFVRNILSSLTSQQIRPSEVFYKKGVLKNFAEFREKHKYLSLF